ncbi:hypothetical protein HYU07_04955 [Candidatus Woesearchaeota archaeon]|nr:hypothetical protein [Candidatus Woesearchaeota archaeon]
MVSLYCKKCGYRMDKEKMPERCPYCGKIGTMARVRSAQDLLNEAVDEGEFFEMERAQRKI